MKRSNIKNYLKPLFLLIIFIAAACAATAAFGQEDAAAGLADASQSGDTGGAGKMTVFSIIAAGGVIGYVIILASLIAFAFIVENFLSINRRKLVPEQLADRLEESIEKSEYEDAKKICAQDTSLLADVVAAGLEHIKSMFGFYDMQNAMQEASERRIAALYRKLEYLAFIGAAAPMLGLLGTVTGMIKSFNQIALTEGAVKPSQLAGGISEALITTCLGLVVAIPAMFFVTFFRNRIDSYVAETESVVEKLMTRFRTGRGEKTQ